MYATPGVNFNVPMQTLTIATATTTTTSDITRQQPQVGAQGKGKGGKGTMLGGRERNTTTHEGRGAVLPGKG